MNPDGPAAEKLTPKGSPSGTDIITHINGQRVKTVAEMKKLLPKPKPEIPAEPARKKKKAK